MSPRGGGVVDLMSIRGVDVVGSYFTEGVGVVGSLVSRVDARRNCFSISRGELGIHDFLFYISFD